jgi:DNA-binding XRE family transcriptional regulator
MANKWSDIRRKHAPEVEERIRKDVKDAARVMSLYQLREARKLTQVNLARVLKVNQGSVSKMEKRTDMYVSTLRGFIQAMGGQLQIKAVFPEGEVEIEQFNDVAIPPAESKPRSGSKRDAAA